MNRTFLIVLWIFFLAGLGLLAIAYAADDRRGAIVVGGMGILFVALGGGVLGYGWLSRMGAAKLRQSGRLIQAEVQGVEVNDGVQVNGASPMRIVAQWHDKSRNELFVFRSKNLWFDPSSFIGKTIGVYVDRNNPSRYHMDVSSLPNVRG